MAELSSSEFLNLTLVLTNYQVVVPVYLGLVVAVKLTELLTTEGRITEKVAKMVVVAGIAAL
jgi:hypothetical protein